MNNNDYIIRLERKDEYRQVENLVREAFWNVYRPGCLEHYVLNQLRNDEAFVKELDFVMEKDGELIDGYIDAVTGEYSTPQGYFVDEAEAEEFDKQFPYKEKLRLPGQIF